MPDFLCPNCSRTNRAGAKFCQGCGAAFLVLAGRYIVGLVEQTSDVATCKALDTWRCQCGALIESTESTSCPECGADPLQPLICCVHKYRAPPHPSQASDEVEMWLYHERGSAWYSVLRPLWQRDWFPNGQRLGVGYASHPGQRSRINEDAVLIQVVSRIHEGGLHTVGIFAVADGMGGHNAGEVASRTAVNSLSSFLLPLLSAEATQDVQQIKDLLTQAVLDANIQVFEIHRQQQLDLGTTLTAAVVTKGLAIVANVGDSRTYLFRAGQLEQITADHSLVYRLVQKKEITPDEIYSHPERNKIYRFAGDQSQLDVDIFEVRLEPDDRLLLCCDGLWEMVRNEGIAQILQDVPDPQTACDELIRQANAAGGEDNISVIVVDILAQGQSE